MQSYKGRFLRYSSLGMLPNMFEKLEVKRKLQEALEKLEAKITYMVNCANGSILFSKLCILVFAKACKVCFMESTLFIMMLLMHSKYFNPTESYWATNNSMVVMFSRHPPKVHASKTATHINHLTNFYVKKSTFTE